jgi:hypothetical protein
MHLDDTELMYVQYPPAKRKRGSDKGMNIKANRKRKERYGFCTESGTRRKPRFRTYKPRVLCDQGNIRQGFKADPAKFAAGRISHEG